MQIKRDAVTTATAALSIVMIVALPALAAPAGRGDWKFEVLLDDKEVGYHNFSVQDDGLQTVLTTEASFDVKFLFVTAFRYRHQNTEIWTNGCLNSIDAVTDSNGKRLEVRGRQGDGGFVFESQSGDAVLAECVQSFAYWDPSILSADRLLNSQTGDYEDVSVTFESEDAIRVNEDLVDALRYRLSAKAGDITLWYSNDDSRRWLALEAPAKGGRKIRYQPLKVPPVDNLQQQFSRSY